MADVQLSQHFWLSEFTLSQTASRSGIDNTPSNEIINNLTILAKELELVRRHIGAIPIDITSGYRSPELNKAVGGSSSSAHMYGFAADFVAAPLTPYEICLNIASSHIQFDQLIYEYTWVHFGLAYNPKTWRRQCLTVQGSGYIEGIVGP